MRPGSSWRRNSSWRARNCFSARYQLACLWNEKSQMAQLFRPLFGKARPGRRVAGRAGGHGRTVRKCKERTRADSARWSLPSTMTPRRLPRRTRHRQQFARGAGEPRSGSDGCSCGTEAGSEPRRAITALALARAADPATAENLMALNWARRFHWTRWSRGIGCPPLGRRFRSSAIIRAARSNSRKRRARSNSSAGLARAA
jgi:hypothetical protein